MTQENKQNLNKAEKIISERLERLEKIQKSDSDFFFSKEENLEEKTLLKQAKENIVKLNKFYKTK